MIFYFVISLLIATIFCYVIFLVKNSFLRQDIEKQIEALKTVGTEQQRADEREVIIYKKKINDFATLLQNHHFSSNVFAFMQQETMPNIWFKQFSMNQKSSTVQLSGEADDLDAISRQVAVFERSRYIKNFGTLTTSLGTTARSGFSVNLSLNENIFNYLAIEPLFGESEEPEPEEGNPPPENNGPEASPGAENDAKFILSFRLPLNPEVVGVLDHTNYTVTLAVPYETDVANLEPTILVSPGATVSPASKIEQNFAGPIIYTVTAQDGSTQDYTARVIVGLPPAERETSQAGAFGLIIIVFCFIIILVLAVVLLILRKRKKQKMNQKINLEVPKK